MKNVITLFVLFLGIITFAQSKKEQKIKELITLSDGSKVLSVAIKQFIDSYKEKYKDLPDSFWSEFLREGDSNKITDLYISIYEKFLTDAEIDQLLAFYKTDLGKKMLANMLPIMQGAIQASEIFTEAELVQLAEFNKTGVSSKMASIMPSIVKETQMFAEDLNNKIKEKINKHYGYQSPPPPPSSAPQK